MAGHRRFERLLTDLESVVLPLTLMTCKRFCSLLVKPKIQTLSGVWFFKGGVGSTFNPRGLWPPMTGGYVPLVSSPSHQPSPWHHCLRWWRLAGCPPQFTLFHSAINTHWWSFMKRFVGKCQGISDLIVTGEFLIPPNSNKYTTNKSKSQLKSSTKWGIGVSSPVNRSTSLAQRTSTHSPVWSLKVLTP